MKEIDAMSRTPLRIGIVGAGVSGLAAAHRLLELSNLKGIPVEPTIFEASTCAGGTISTTRADGFLIENGPDSFISEKPQAIDLSKRLGIESRLIPTNEENRRSMILRNGKLIKVPDGFRLLAPGQLMPFFSSPIFSLRGKLRMACEPLIPRKSMADGEDESLASFVRRRLGREALDRMAQPMVGGIYTSDPELLSIKATMPAFLKMESKHGSIIRALMANRHAQAVEERNGTSGPRYGLFLSYDGGMQTLVDALCERIGPERVRFKTEVEWVAKNIATECWVVKTRNGQEEIFDAVILAVPSYVAAQLIRDVIPDLSSQLEQIQYASTAIINVAFERSDIEHSLDAFGFVVPRLENRTVLACSFSSVKFSGRAPKGKVLMRAFAGGALQPEIFDLDEEELAKRVITDLDEILGIRGRPLWVQVRKWPRSMAQYHVGHLDRIKKIQQRVTLLRTMKLAGNAYGGAGIPDCIRSGESAADELFAMATKESRGNPLTASKHE
jgi:oxygen-dependent protoporphyrinogen oxidase